MAERPRIALLIPPASLGRMFTEEALARLSELGQVVRGDGTSDEIAADLPELLENVDVAVTGWGAPPIPAELFGPRLKLVAHAAGRNSSRARRLAHGSTSKAFWRWTRQAFVRRSAARP